MNLKNKLFYDANSPNSPLRPRLFFLADSASLCSYSAQCQRSPPVTGNLGEGRAMECSTAASCPAPFKPLPSRNEWRKWVKHSLWLLAVIIAVYSAAGLWAVRGDLARASQSLPWRVLPPVMGLVVLGWALRSLRWHYYVRHLRWPVSLSHSLLAFFASFAFSATPGKVGEVVKSVLLRTRYDVPLADGAGVLLVERLGDLLAILVLSAGGLVLLADGVPYFILARR